MEFDDLDLVSASKEIKNLAEQYFDHYEEVKELEGMLKMQKEMLEQIKAELIESLDSIGMKTYSGLEGVNLTRSARQFIKVVDFKGLSNYIEQELNEPLDEYGSFRFDNEKLKSLVVSAKQKMLRESIPLEEALPKGIELGFTDIVSVKSKQ